MLKNEPTGAIIAVTSACNSKCIMCDFWKHKKKENLPLSVLKKLPLSLDEIDITGGEPFLRDDLPKIVEIVKKSCPRARLLITTNGLLTKKISDLSRKILKIDKKVGFRVSLDGWGKTHDLIRGIPKAFEEVLGTLKSLKEMGVKDLGVIFTLTKENVADLEKILNYLKKEYLELSVNLVHDSEIYFGGKHLNLRPTLQETKKALTLVKNFYKGKVSLKSLAKIWFYDKLLIYSQTGERPIPCGAGENFFYLDSRANVYPCHFKNWNIGNLKDQSFKSIWYSKRKAKYLESAENCQDCFMICTARDEIKKRKWKILEECLLA